MKKTQLLLYLVLLFSCSDKSTENFFNGSMRTVEFPDKISLTGEFINVDSVGIGCVEIFAPYLFLSTYRLPYFTKVYKHNSSLQN